MTWKVDVPRILARSDRPFRPLARPPTFTHLLTLLSSTFLSLYPVHGPSYTMRSVALSALLVVAAASASNADETPKPVFKVRTSALTRK